MQKLQRRNLLLKLGTLFCTAAATHTAAHALEPSILQLFFTMLWQCCLVSALLLVCFLYPPSCSTHITSLLGNQIARIPFSERWFLLVCGTMVTVVCAYLSGFLFHHVPHVNDTVNQYIHAKFLASGHIAIDSHPLKDFFDSGWMINDGRWYSAYSPGHILFLALGHLAGFPWLVNPILGGLTVVSVYFLAKELYGKPTAIVAAILASLCPMLIFMSSEYMNHATSLLCATLFMLFFLRMRRTAQAYDALLAGAAFGYLAITRPYTAFAIALPFACIGLYDLIRTPYRYIKPFSITAATIAAFACFHGWWNLMTTGHFFTPAYYHLLGDEHLPGLGTNPFGHTVHTFSLGIDMLIRRILDMNEKLFEWPIPSLTLVLLLFTAGSMLAADWILLSVYVSLAVFYVFFEGSSEVFGPRYHYEAISSLIILTAACLTRIPVFIHHLTSRYMSIETASGMAMILLVILYSLSSQSGFKHRLAVYGNHYREGNYDYYHEIETSVRKPALVFIKDRMWPYLYVAFTLPPTDDSPIIFARNKQANNIDLIRYYPCRYAYMKVDGNSQEDSQLVLLYNPPYDCKTNK